MLSKFSVKRPYAIVVAVIVALVLGGVSFTRMRTDLMPEMDLPYLAVITTDPGASAEEIETEVTDVLESALATVNGVASVTSTSEDNYSMVFLEFEEGTDMDSALVKVSSAANEVAAALPDSAGAPNYMEISADMMATLYVAASDTTMDPFELTDFVEETLVPEFERLDGVADVSVAGSAEQTVEVRLNDGKIASINDRLADQVTSQFTDGYAQLDDAQAQIAASQADLDAQRADLDAWTNAQESPDAYAQLDAAQATLNDQSAQLNAQRADLDAQRDEALRAATIDALVDKDALAQLIAAQDFAMPAGYIDDADDGQWLVRVGEHLPTVEELETLALTQIEGIGTIELSDVADVTVVDNVGESYTRLNGETGLLLSVYKASTASTSEVSDAAGTLIADLEEDYPDLELAVVTDQGSYIDLFIESITQSLLIGALLAVIVLAIFLRDWKPTLVVAFSIPFSVLLAFVFMYFTDMDLNVVTLGGIALSIGMLVDNSIVVLENIYRLRTRGIEPARAAVQGAKQMTGAVVASTLTTICVYLPVVFTTGLVSQIMAPFALTIAYVLGASLIVALTLVPSLAARIFKNVTVRDRGWFERLRDAYARSLDFFLRHKALPILVSIALLAFSVVGVLSMGVNLMPSMTNKTIMATVTVPEGTERDAAFETADAVMDAALDIDGVEAVGAMDGASTLSVVSSAGGSSESSFTQFVFYIQADDTVTKESQVTDIVEDLEKATRKLDCEIVTSANSSSEMSSMLSSGLTLTITGRDRDTLLAISEDVMALVDEVDGYTEITNGTEEAPAEATLSFDRAALAERGLTVAQVYSALSDVIATEADAMSMSFGSSTAQVKVVDERSVPAYEDLLATELDLGDQTLVLGDVATVAEGTSSDAITHIDSVPAVEVSAEVEDGENNALLSRELQEKLDDYDLPDGYEITFSGEIDNVNTMIEQMLLMASLGFVLIYLVMVAQFQSLLSPFIVVLTVPLAFTGGFLGLLMADQQLDIMALMGFLMLMGTIVNNGIVFVDYVNQLRRGGLEKREALVESGRTRMRPILMTALTTILSMLPLVFSQDVGGSMQRGMAIVVVGGMVYATFMTLYVVPIMYDLLYHRVPKEVDLGDENIDDDPGDAEAYLAELAATRTAAADAPAGEPGVPQGRQLPHGTAPDPRPDARA